MLHLCLENHVFSYEEQEKVYRNISVDGPLNTRLMFYDLIRMVDF